EHWLTQLDGVIGRCPLDDGLDRAHDGAGSGCVVGGAGVGGITETALLDKTYPNHSLLEPFTGTEALIAFFGPGINNVSSLDGRRLNPIVIFTFGWQNQNFIFATWQVGN